MRERMIAIIVLAVIVLWGWLYFLFSKRFDWTTHQQTTNQIITWSNSEITTWFAEDIDLSYNGEWATTNTDDYFDNMENREVITTWLIAPWSIAFGKWDDIIVTERGGNVLSINKKNGTKITLWTLPAEQPRNAESWLMWVALNTNMWATDVYLAYTYKEWNQMYNKLVRIPINNNKLWGEEVLIDKIPGANFHDWWTVKFWPDNKLYRSIGDAGNDKESQNTGSYNGKILRVNIDGSIPDDNPYSGSYIRSYWHRNVQWIAWQPGTNILWATEHGPSSVFPACCNDEINIILPWGNYWRPVIRSDQTKKWMITPKRISGKNTTWAPAGIAFIDHWPWQGNLLIAGLKGESLYRVVFDENTSSNIIRIERHLSGMFWRIRDVAVDDFGYIYIITNNTDWRQQSSKIRKNDDKLLRIQMGWQP